jgi:hypothetical protein
MKHTAYRLTTGSLYLQHIALLQVAITYCIPLTTGSLYLLHDSSLKVGILLHTAYCLTTATGSFTYCLTPHYRFLLLTAWYCLLKIAFIYCIQPRDRKPFTYGILHASLQVAYTYCITPTTGIFYLQHTASLQVAFTYCIPPHFR